MPPASAPKSKPAPSKNGGTPYAGRMDRLRALAQKATLGHMLVSNPNDVGYLTGFFGGESYLLISPTIATVISDFRYVEELEETKEHVGPGLNVFSRKGGMAEAVAEVFTATRVDRCGFQAEHLTLADQAAIAKALGKGPQNRLVSTTNLCQQLRVIKDEHEVALIQKAVKLQEEALKATLKQIKAGQSEIEVAAILEFEMKTRGSSRPGFETIVAAKANGSLPHYRPGEKTKVTKDQPLLIDWGAVYHGYQGDMTRTFALGKWPKKVQEIYAIVLEAQEASAAALAPGKSTHEVDRIARKIIEDAGYGEEFGHGLGHGLGISKEPPWLNPKYPDQKLEIGMVCTVEPGIYLPGVGGVRIEDQYVITEKGAKNFCSLPKDLEWSTL
jgi:Xaa-Pro aminopeptidase